MREIKFRGKTRYAIGEQIWVYGNLCHDGLKKGGWCIETEPGRMIGIDPKTVGEFTGLYDKNGREIYEGDILHIVRYGGELQTIGDVFEEKGAFRVHNGYAVADTDILGQFKPDILEVIGNIHENPELLEAPHA